MAEKKKVAVKTEEAKVASASGKKTADQKTAAKKITAKETATNKIAVAPQVAKKTPVHGEIARLAFQLWIERGRPHGSDRHDWLRAEQQLKKGE